VLQPDPSTYELTMVAVHPGVDVDEVREATGWHLSVHPDLGVTEPPTEDELRILRELKERTALAHVG
jgi:glutaconate CoA-transferase subunit B